MHSRPLALLALYGAAAAVFLPSAATAEPVEVVFGIAAQAPSSPKSLIPGGLNGFPDARFTNFNNKFNRSPTTNRWLVVATTNATPTSADQVLVIGSGLTAGIHAQEGETEIADGEFINFSRLDTPRLNDSDQWAVAFRLGVLGAGALDERLVKWDGEAFSVTRFADAVPVLPGEFYGGSFNGACITNSGETAFQATIAPFSGANDAAFGGSGETVLINTGVDSPTGQSAAEPQPWSDIDANALTINADGTRWCAFGEVGFDPSIDRVVVVDGAVVLQEGTAIAGMTPSAPVSVISDAFMESNGDWFARGTNLGGVTWVVRNGVVIAQSGAPIVPGSSELWESFRSIKGNNRGSYVINGNSNAATLTDDVLVVNGERVVARESDPVDLDGNGQFDDSLFLHLVQDHCVLMDDGYFYFASRLKDSPTASAGAAGSNNASIVRVLADPPPPVCRADFNGDGFRNPDDLADFITCFFLDVQFPGFCADADFNGDTSRDPDDLADFITTFFLGCP